MKTPAYFLWSFIEQADRLMEGLAHQEQGDAYRTARAALIRSFGSEAIDLHNLAVTHLCVNNIAQSGSFERTRWSVEGRQIETLLKKVQQRYQVPIVLDPEEAAEVISLMSQWKCATAAVRAENTAGFPPQALALLDEMAVKFGNCGPQSGSVFGTIHETHKKVAPMIGYDWDEEKNKFVPMDQPVAEPRP